MFSMLHAVRRRWLWRRLPGLLAVVLMPAVIGVTPPHVSAMQNEDKLTAATIIVNSTADPGDGVCDAVNCTLREAINRANTSPGVDSINFNIPGAGPHTIQPASALPSVTDPVIIDGTTQLVGRVELNGSNAGANTTGLTIQAGASVIRGLVINRFDGDGIALTGRGGNRIEGNTIGVDVTGQTALGNRGSGILIDGTADNVIGGVTSGAGNVISANQRAGVFLFDTGASGNVVQGNFIGTDRTGARALGNAQDGVLLLYAAGNQIGGVASEARNVISGNGGSGVYIYQVTETGNLVQGNYIGTDATGAAALGNAAEGVLLVDASFNQIGGAAQGTGNLIAGNSGNGIRLVGSSEGAAQNTIQGNVIGADVSRARPIGNGQDGIRLIDTMDTRIGGLDDGAGNTIMFNGSDGIHITLGTGNSIRRNAIAGNARLGIDLLGDGVTANDTNDPDSGPNNLQNYPVLNSFTLASGGVTVRGVLNSTPGTRFSLDFFASAACDATGFGEGQSYLTSSDVTTDGGGNASFDITLPITTPAGQAITVTTTDPNGNTSEFSRCLVLPGAATPTPTTTPTPTATPTRTVTPTATQPAGQYRLFLPLLMKQTRLHGAAME